MTTTKQMSEEATGIRQNGKGLGPFYDENGQPVPHKHAHARLMAGKIVEVPNAGAGSYEQFFLDAGFEQIKEVNTTSSAGDWTFGVLDGDTWYIAYQENRYPHYGFTYAIDTEQFSTSFADLCKFS